MRHRVTLLSGSLLSRSLPGQPGSGIETHASGAVFAQRIHARDDAVIAAISQEVTIQIRADVATHGSLPTRVTQSERA